MEKLHLESVIQSGDYKGMTVENLVEQKGVIFSLIRDFGYEFDDDVLQAANITHIIRDVRFEYQVVDKEKVKEKPLPKDTASVKEILREINTIESQAEQFVEKEEKENFYSDNMYSVEVDTTLDPEYNYND